MWVEELCRLCAQVSELLFPIYEKHGDKVRLDLKIKKCLSITVDENDQKPRNICYTCCNKLEEMNEFLEICQNTDYKFETILFNATQQNQTQTIVDSRKLILEENKSLMLDQQSKWDSEKINHQINQEINQQSQMVQHDGVIVVQKVSDDNQTMNRDCQDILLMVELKYKDVDLDPQVSQSNKIIYQDSSIIQQDKIVFPQSVLRHSDDFTKINTVGKSPNINISSIEYLETNSNSQNSANFLEQPVELIKTNVIQENKNSRVKLKPFPCTQCNKSFMRRSNLNAHMAAHTLVKPYQCTECDRSFAIRWNLTVHQRIHSGLYSCEFCGKAFPVKGKLERHRRTHTGEKPFICPVPNCEKAFADKRNLETHNRTHTQEKPYVCQICSRGFGSKSHMIDHQKVHSKEAAFTCDTCGKSFKWKTNLTLHMKSHSGEKCLCLDCGKQFMRRSQLNKHRKIFHPETIINQIDLRKKSDIL